MAKKFFEANCRGSYSRYTTEDDIFKRNSWNSFSNAPVSNENRTIPKEEIYGVNYLVK